MTEEATYVKNNLIFYDGMETIQNWGMMQESRFNRDYIDCACEAMTKNSGKAAILQKLYNEISNKSTFDTALIDASKGTFTKFKGYASTIDSIEALEKLFNDESKADQEKYGESLVLLRKLNAILETYRPDFEFGYKANEFIVISFYRMCILCMLELINVGMVNYMLIVRNTKVDISLKKNEQRRIVLDSRRLIGTFNKGNFGKMMKALKNNKPATEGIISTIGGKIFGIATGGAGTISSIISGGLPVAIAVIASWWVLVMCVHYFFIASAKIESWLSNQAELIKFNIETDSTDTSNEKKEQLLDTLQSIARFFRVKILRTEEKAKEEDKEFTQTELDRGELQSITENAELYDEIPSTYGQYQI